MDNHTEQEIGQPHGNFPKSFGAIILIATGVILFLDNLGFLPFAHLRAYWPLAISAFGFAMMSRSRTGCSMVWPWTAITIGILLTLGNLGIIHANIHSIWPIFLVSAGLNMLLRRSGWRMPARHYFVAETHSRDDLSGNPLRIHAVFSGVSRRIDSANFEGAGFDSVFAELKVDLRGATISTADHRAIIDTNVAFGAIKLRVPETWRVVMEGNAVFGAYEDKTVPPRPAPGIDPPILIIRGDAAFGAVEVEN